MIICGGYNIAGPEVESALLLHPAVAECGVIGVADEERGQIVKAFVVLQARPRRPTTPLVKTLQDFVKQTIAPYKYPRAIEFRSDAAAHRDRQAAALSAAAELEQRQRRRRQCPVSSRAASRSGRPARADLVGREPVVVGTRW